MSQMQIDSVLAQIRSFSHHGAGVARVPGGLGEVGHARGADAYERGAPDVDLAQVMLETQKASVSFRGLAEVRNRLVNVYQEIMNMPI